MDERPPADSLGRRSGLFLLILTSLVGAGCVHGSRARVAKAEQRPSALSAYRAPSKTRLGQDSRPEGDAEAIAEAIEEAAVHPWSSAAAYRHFLAGRVAMETGAFGMAERELEEALLHDGESAQLQLALANARFRAGKLESARRSVEQTLKLAPKLRPALLLLALLQSAEGQSGQAIASLERAVALYPKDTVATTRLAGLYLDAGRFADAELAYARLEDRRADHQAPWRSLGRSLEQDHDLAAARRAYQRALAVHPDSSKAAEDLGRVNSALIDRVGAVEAYQLAIKLDPGRWSLKLRLARLLGELGRPKEALAYERQLLQTDPGSPDTLLQVALTAADRGSLELARRRLEAARALAPERQELEFFLGYVLEGLGKKEQAEQAYRRALADAVHGKDARSALSSLLMREGDAGAALSLVLPEIQAGSRELEWIALAIEAAGRLGQAKVVEGLVARLGRSELGRVRIAAARAKADEALGKGLESLRRIRAALRLRPLDQDLRYLLATLLAGEGRQDEALTLMREVVASSPNRADALNFLAYTLASQEGANPRAASLQQAERLARQAAEIEPTNGYILDTLGWVLRRLGKLEEAQLFLDRASELLPAEAEVLFHRGLLLQARGQQEEGKRSLLKAQGFAPPSGPLHDAIAKALSELSSIIP